MVPWGLIAGGVALVVFPQHKGAILVAGAILNVIKNGDNSDGNNGKDKNIDTDTIISGKVKQVHLEWKDVDCKLLDKKGQEVKKLLKGVNGMARPGRLLAIMGPSGSGKTTLLNTLAGQMPKSDKVSLEGQIFANGRPAGSSSHRQAYVRQEDIFFSQLTVRETLLMAGKLQLPRSMSAANQEAYIDQLIQRLGLVSCAGTIVGDAKARGISGGEKKRLSIACELISRPSVIFADEPTTGLDAFQAERVMHTLCELAHSGHTVVCSIHQPRGSIYNMFDDLLLLAEGDIVYAGPAGEEALAHFADLGHKCPQHCNPAEFFSDIISTDYSSTEAEESTRKRIFGFVDKFRQNQKHKVLLVTDSSDGGVAPAGTLSQPVDHRRGGWWTQFKLLLHRAWRQTTRDKATNVVRVMMNLSSALIFGSVFWRMGFGQTTIQDRMGLLQVVAINTAMSSLTKTVNVFPREKLIVQRERTKRSYDITPYFFSKLLAELPIGAAFPLLFANLVYPMTGLNRKLSRYVRFLGILTLESFTASALGLAVGAVAPSSEAGMALGPAIMTVFIVFGGYYVNPDNTPWVFRWLPNVSLIRWAFQALAINEFEGLQFQTSRPTDAKTGNDVLERLSLGDKSISQAVVMECKILLGFYYITFHLLRARKPRFQALKPTRINSDQNDVLLTTPTPITTTGADVTENV